MRKVLMLLVAAGLGPSSAAFAQTRPLLTEEAATAVAGTLCLEVGADFIRDEVGFLSADKRDRADAPVLRLVYSPASNVEIDVEWAARVAAFGDRLAGNVSDWGDVTLRAKVRLVEGRRGPTLAGRFGVTLPETPYATGIGPNTLRASVQALATQSLAGWRVHANAGLAVYDEVLRLHGQRDFFHYGLALERPLGAHASGVVEANGLAGDGMPAVEAHHELRLGVRVGGARLRGDAALRRGLGRADGTWGATAGLSWLIRRGRP
jgi:hypothetical protein